MAMRWRFHSVGWKKAAQTAYRPATFYPLPRVASSFPHQRRLRVDVSMLMFFAKRRTRTPAPLLSQLKTVSPRLLPWTNLNIPLHFPLALARPVYTPTEADRGEDLVRNIHKNSGDFLMNRNYKAEGKYIITAMILLTNTCLVLLRHFFSFFFFYYPPPTCPFSLLGFSHREESCS